MFGELFNTEASILRKQRFDLNYSTLNSENLSAGGQASINQSIDNGDVDEFINSTLVKKFSELKINNDLPLIQSVSLAVDPLGLSGTGLTSVLTSTQASDIVVKKLSTLSNLKRQQQINTAQGLNDRYTSRPARRQAAITDTRARSSALTLARQKTKSRRRGRRGRKGTPLPMSIKKDLTPDQIGPVAVSLVRHDALSFFLKN